jgi:esterase
MSGEALPLHYRELGARDKPVLILLHGLFGSYVNWQAVANYFREDYRLILPDLRNHGRSPHGTRMDYPLMAADLLLLMERLELESASLIGHSMGGKCAMWLALSQPERVERLVVADIAPVAYTNRFEQLFQGLREVQLEQLQDRGAADRSLAQRVSAQPVRQYLLQNLVKGPDGWGWRFNLPVLEAAMERLGAFPPTDELSFAGRVLFLYGERSEYVLPDHQGRIGGLFPHARLRMLNGAGHWLYAERPEAFSRAVKAFLR